MFYRSISIVLALIIVSSSHAISVKVIFTDNFKKSLAPQEYSVENLLELLNKSFEQCQQELLNNKNLHTEESLKYACFKKFKDFFAIYAEHNNSELKIQKTTDVIDAELEKKDIQIGQLINSKVAVIQEAKAKERAEKEAIEKDKALKQEAENAKICSFDKIVNLTKQDAKNLQAFLEKHKPILIKLRPEEFERILNEISYDSFKISRKVCLQCSRYLTPDLQQQLQKLTNDETTVVSEIIGIIVAEQQNNKM